VGGDAPSGTSEAKTRPPPLLLYSTNTYLKFRIQEDYRGEHHAWCSPVFAAETLNKYAIGAGTPPSSDPASIYRDLHGAVRRADEHNGKIIAQKTVMMALAVEWCNNGLITAGARDEITTIVRMAPFLDWRPLLFIIPYACVSDRVREAPREKRASTEREFIVPDLKRDEFDIIELAL
jgi:hypothetical protein